MMHNQFIASSNTFFHKIPRIILLFAGISLSSLLFANQQNNELFDAIDNLPNGTNYSLLVKSMTHQDSTSAIFSLNANRLMMPASTQKLITALAAKLYWGGNFKFITLLEMSGKIKKNQIDGDLIFRFSGDPTLTKNHINAMLSKVKQMGITQVNGDIILDNSIFSSHDRAMGWSWNNMTYCFNAPPAAINIDGNCFTTRLSADKKNNKQTSLFIPKNIPVRFANNVSIIANNDNKQEKYCELDIIAHDGNRYTLAGCLKKNQLPLNLTFSIQDPNRYAQDLIKQLLSNQNIIVKGQFKVNDSLYNKKTNLLVSHSSASLDELLDHMIKTSNNLIADTLFRKLGADYFKISGTWRSGSDAVKEILRSHADIDLNNAIIIDGSGLSRQNLISAQDMMLILNYIAKNDDKLNMINMLPTSGVDGTLKFRKSLSSEPLNGNIHAKTGMLDGVYNLAGFIKTRNGQSLGFVQFISGYSPQSADNAQKRSELLNFENKFYQSIYQKE